MLGIAHLLVAILLIRLFRLDKNEIFATLLFGVFIDFDHVFGMAEFVKQDGIENALNLDAALTSDVQWKSLMHDPMATFVLVPAAIGFRFFVPLLAWGMHLTMDYVQINYLGVMSVAEFVFLGVLLAVFLYIEARDIRHSGKEFTVRNLFGWWGAQLNEGLRDTPVLCRLTRKKGSEGNAG